MMTDVWLIVVLYNPKDLDAWVRLATTGEFHMIFVDNSPERDYSAVFSHSTAVYLRLGANTGIAHAQNVGVASARKRGATRLVFFDQDSSVTPELVRGLVSAYEACKRMDAQTFAVGPSLVDAYAPTCEQHQAKRSEEEFVFDDYLASSGTVVGVEDAVGVGDLDERLFISDVDYEWIWRARSKGMRSYRSRRIRMMHPIGEESLYAFGKKLGLSKPVRYFHQVRNWFLLLRCPYVPRGWRMREARNLVASVLYLCVCGPRRWETLACAWRGLVAGLGTL